ADFVFSDFNSTHGLSFVGSSGTTTCINSSALRYGAFQGRADEQIGMLDVSVSEAEHAVKLVSVETSTMSDQEGTTNNRAGFGHRENATQSPDVAGERCRVRARLTPSLPSKTGAMWYSVPVPVTRGFETIFTITDQSRVCTEHMDPFFSRNMHTTCSIRGGDGLAFVLHGDPRGDSALGIVGGEMGYGGLLNSMAVELDTWYNPDSNSTDIVYDHIGVHSGGPEANNSAREWAELAPPHQWDLADGKHHIVKVKYYPRLATEYLANFTATPAVLPYLKDNGVNRRLGTIVIWVDDGVQSGSPILAIPINLSVLLNLPQDQAYVGFTSSTGRAWAKHDIISWYWCHNDGGQEEDSSGSSQWDGCGSTPGFSEFSYGQTTKYFPESRVTYFAPTDT
ncbi:unnamed protein product, partial [Choristocarpus tenellus]